MGKVVVVVVDATGDGGFGGSEELGAVRKLWEWQLPNNRHCRKMGVPKLRHNSKAHQLSPGGKGGGLDPHPIGGGGAPPCTIKNFRCEAQEKFVGLF